MKRIITLAALAAMTSQIHAATASDLIRQMHGVSEHRTEPAARLHSVRTHPVARQHLKKRHAQNNRTAKPNRPAIRRHFRTLDQYRHAHRNARNVHHRLSQHRMPAPKHFAQHGGKKMGRYVGNGWFEDEHGQYDEQYQNNDGYLWIPSQSRRQHGYRHYRRQWYLTYLYEHAEFDDKHGYHYGYFDRRGFVFDGQYYRYDRAYTYQDRLHGKGLFEHRFYRPIRHRDFFDGGHFHFEWQF